VAYSGRPSRSWCGDGSIDDGSDHRTIERGGERLWVLTDVCEANDIGNPSDVAKRLSADEKDTLDIIDSMGRPRPVIVVNEAGLYEAMRQARRKAKFLARCRKPRQKLTSRPSKIWVSMSISPTALARPLRRRRTSSRRRRTSRSISRWRLREKVKSDEFAQPPGVV
jgi:prophage antirepressor-like protein